MSGLLTRGGGENFPGITGACAPAIRRIWQEVHEVDSDFLPSGYLAFRDDKCKTKHGVLIAYRKGLIMSNVNIKDRSCELVLAKLQVVGKPDLYAGFFYQHTNSDTASTQALRENLQEILSKEQMKNIVLAVDFNLPNINWESNEISSPPQYGRDVNQMALGLCNDLFSKQVVEEPTRGRNRLDLLFVSCPDLVNSVHVKPGISDDDLVVTGIALGARISKKKPRTVFMDDKADQGILASNIATLKDEILTEGSERDANSNWQIFTQGLKKIMENCIPQKVIKGRYNIPWLDHSLRKNIRKKNKYHRLAKRAKPQKRPRRWNAYRQLQATVRSETHTAYDRYTNSLFGYDSGKPSKRLW